MPEAAHYISQADAAARWSVSVDTIRRLIASGKLTGFRINARIIRVDVAELDECFRPIPTVRTVA
jgi:excisionase family DNA binding protein